MKDQKEIPVRFDELEKEITALEEEVGMLASAIVPITSQETPQTDVGEIHSVKSHTCEMAEKLAIQTAKITDVRSRVNSLTNRVQI